MTFNVCHCCVIVCVKCVCVCVVGAHSFVAVGTEEARMVAFLHNNVGDAWLVLLLQADTGLTNGQQLIIQHLRKWEQIHNLAHTHLSYIAKDITLTENSASSFLLQTLTHHFSERKEVRADLSELAF